MRTFLCLLAGVTLAWTTSAADLKVGVLDLQRAMTEYDRAKEVQKRLLEMQTSFEKEFHGLRLEGEQRVKEVESLRELVLDNALSETARAQKKKEYESKLLDLRTFEIKYDAFQRDGQTQLQETSRRLTKSLLDDIVRVTYDLGEKEGFNLILNSNKANPAASDVLFAGNVDDVTSKVITALNTRRPVQSPPPHSP